MGHVDHPHQPERERQPERDQQQNRAEAEAVEELGENERHHHSFLRIEDRRSKIEDALLIFDILSSNVAIQPTIPWPTRRSWGTDRASSAGPSSRPPRT